MEKKNEKTGEKKRAKKDGNKKEKDDDKKTLHAYNNASMYPPLSKQRAIIHHYLAIYFTIYSTSVDLCHESREHVFPTFQPLYVL